MWTGNNFEIDLTFIRHGSTKSNLEKKYISFTDESLDDIGLSAIQNNLNLKIYPDADKVFCSSLKRTKETASIIYPNIKPVEVPDFDEINFGTFEGKTYDELKDNDNYKNWLDSNCTSKIPDGESRDTFTQRLVRGLNTLLFESKEDSSISLVCHGGTIMGLFSNYIDGDYFDFMTKSGGLYKTHICFQIKGENNVSISSFSIVDRHNS